MDRLFVFLFGLFFCIPASSQTGISPITGWKQQVSNGINKFTPKSLFNTGVSYEILPLQKISEEGEKDIAEWLKLTAINSLLSSGYTTSSMGDRQSTEENGYYFYAIAVKISFGKTLVFSFISYQRQDGQMRLAKYTQPGDVKTPHLDTAINHFINLSKTEGRMKRDGMPSSKNKTNEQDKSDDQSIKKDEQQMPTVVRGQGVKPNDVEGVVIHEEYGYGVGGMLIIEFKPYLLLKDGSIFKYPKISPYDLDVKTSKQKETDKWGTWKLQGKTLVVQMPDKGVMKTNEWKDKKWFWTKPAAKDEVITGSFITMSGGGNTIVGGTTLIAVSNHIRFNSKGQFTHATSAGTISNEADGNAGGYSETNKAGTYKLSGYTIELRYNNGQNAKTLFYFFPDGKDNFGLGGHTYTKD